MDAFHAGLFRTAFYGVIFTFYDQAESEGYVTVQLVKGGVGVHVLYCGIRVPPR